MPITQPPPVQPDTAGSEFGNKEDITSVMFNPTAPPNPVKPDFISEGKLFDAQAVLAGATETSKSCRMVAHPSAATIKSFYLQSNQAGTLLLEVMLDEGELSGGNPVWRSYTDPTSPIAVAANKLVHLDVEGLFRQARLKFTNTSGSPATVNGWAFSI